MTKDRSFRRRFLEMAGIDQANQANGMKKNMTNGFTIMVLFML